MVFAESSRPKKLKRFGNIPPKLGKDLFFWIKNSFFGFPRNKKLLRNQQKLFFGHLEIVIRIVKYGSQNINPGIYGLAPRGFFLPRNLPNIRSQNFVPNRPAPNIHNRNLRITREFRQMKSDRG